jgi:hypothetical protein
MHVCRLLRSDKHLFIAKDLGKLRPLCMNSQPRFTPTWSKSRVAGRRMMLMCLFP